MAFWRLLEAPGGFWLPERPDPAIWTPRASRSSSGGFWRLLEASGGSWRGYWRLLEAPGGSWALLEGFWELLEGLLEVPGGCWSFRRLLEASGGFWRGYWRLLEAPGSSQAGGPPDLFTKHLRGANAFYFSPTSPRPGHFEGIPVSKNFKYYLGFLGKSETNLCSGPSQPKGWVEVLRG